MTKTSEVQTKPASPIRPRWIRRDVPQDAGWPWGALYLGAILVLVLYGLVFFAPQVIEKQTADRVRARMLEAGVQRLEVVADGQSVRVQGRYPADRSVHGLAALARLTRCPTLLFGALICPTGVQVDLRPILASSTQSRRTSSTFAEGGPGPSGHDGGDR